LEDKLQTQGKERQEDCQRFTEIMNHSKECFKDLFMSKDDLNSTVNESAVLEEND
jgi:hypothetical protein